MNRADEPHGARSVGCDHPMAASRSRLLMRAALCVVAAACSRPEAAGDGLEGVTLRVGLSPTNHRDGKQYLRCEILLPRDMVAAPEGRRWLATTYDVEIEELQGEGDDQHWWWSTAEGGGVSCVGGHVVCPGGEAWLSFDSAVSIDASLQQRVRYDQTFEREDTRQHRKMSTGWVRLR